MRIFRRLCVQHVAGLDDSGRTEKGSSETQRIRRTGGFTLTEMLVTTLILLLASTIMTNGISVGIDTYHKTVTTANAQLALSTTIAALRGELGTAHNVYVDSDDNQKVYYYTDDGWASIGKLDVAGQLDAYDYRGLVKQSYSGNAVQPDGTVDVTALAPVGKQLPLIPDESITSTSRYELQVVFDTVSYDSSTHVVTIANLRVKDEGGTEFARIGDPDVSSDSDCAILTRFVD